MHSAFRTAIAVVVIAPLLSACSAQPTEFETEVELKNAGTDCDLDPKCWLPTQFQPSLVAGESVSLFNQWPLKGDPVKVVCETSGETLQDSTGKRSNRWFGILVPEEKIDSANTKATRIEGGYLGYVSALWLTDKETTAPNC